MKNLLDKYYWTPVPKFFRKLGDALVATCAAVIVVVGSDPVMFKIVACGLLVGKFITNCFSEKPA